MGSGAGQHAVAGRSRADGGNRPLRDAVEEDGRTAGPRRRVPAGRLAPRRRPRRDRSAPCRRHGARVQGDLRRAQRDVDRRCQQHPRRAPCDRPRGSPGALHGGHDLVARLDRLSPRRMGCRRDGGRLAEGPDAAARAVVQRHQRQGARGIEAREAAALLLGLAGDARGQRQRLFSVHAGDQSALRPGRGAGDAVRRGARQRLRAACAAGRSDAARGARVGARDPVCRSRAVQQFADRGDDAGGPQRRRAAQGGARQFRHVAGPGVGQGRRPGLPHRPSRPFQRADAVRHARGRGDGPRSRRCSAPQGRRAGGDGLSFGNRALDPSGQSADPTFPGAGNVPRARKACRSAARAAGRMPAW